MKSTLESIFYIVVQISSHQHSSTPLSFQIHLKFVTFCCRRSLPRVQRPTIRTCSLADNKQPLHQESSFLNIDQHRLHHKSTLNTQRIFSKPDHHLLYCQWHAIIGKKQSFWKPARAILLKQIITADDQIWVLAQIKFAFHPRKPML